MISVFLCKHEFVNRLRGINNFEINEFILIMQFWNEVLARAFGNKNVVVNGDGEQTRDFVYVKDVARAVVG